MTSCDLDYSSGLALPCLGPPRDFQACRAYAKTGKILTSESERKKDMWRNLLTQIHKSRKNLFAANVT